MKRYSAIRTKIPSSFTKKVFDEIKEDERDSLFGFLNFEVEFRRRIEKICNSELKYGSEICVGDLVLRKSYNDLKNDMEFFIDYIIAAEITSSRLCSISRFLTAEEFETCKEKLINFKLTKEPVIEDLRYVVYDEDLSTTLF